MAELPPVSQRFDADVSGYTSGIEEMIQAADRFLEKNREVIDSVNALHAALDALPDTKVINVIYRQTTEGNAPSGGNVVNTSTLGNNSSSLSGLQNQISRSNSGYQQLIGNNNAASESMDEFAAAALNAARAESAAGVEINTLSHEQIQATTDALNAMHDNEAALSRYTDASADAAMAALRVANSTRSEAEALEDTKQAFADWVAGAEVARGLNDGLLNDNIQLAATQALAAAAMSRLDGYMIDYAGRIRDADVATQDYVARQAMLNEITATGEAVDRSRTDTLLASTGATLAAARASALADEATKVLNGDLGESAAAATASGSAASRAYGFWRLLGREVTLWGGIFGDNKITGQVQLWHILLDGLIETTIGLTEATIGLAIAFATMAPAAMDIATHLKSVWEVSTALHENIPPLTGNFQELARSLAPQVVELYGGALDLFTHKTGALTVAAHQLATGFDDWIAKLDLWSDSQQHTGAIMLESVEVLHQFETIMDNLGLAFDNFLKADPGTVHFLLDFLEGATKVLDVITSLPSPILRTVLALHSIDIWGGLAATAFLKLLNPIGNLIGGLTGVGTASANIAKLGEESTPLQRLQATLATISAGLLNMAAGFTGWVSHIGESMGEAEGVTATATAGMKAAFSGVVTSLGGLAEKLATLAVSPLGLLALGAGIAILVWQLTQADAATKKFVGDMNAELSNMNAGTAMIAISANISQLDAKLNSIGSQFINNGSLNITQGLGKIGNAITGTGQDAKTSGTSWSGLWGGIVDGAEEAGEVINGTWASAVSRQAADMRDYQGQLVTMTKDQSNLFQEAGTIMKTNSLSFADSVGIMNLAGVKAGDGFALMSQKVSNLILGYKNLGVQGGILNSSVEAVTFQTEQQQSKVSALTGAWSNFFSMITGGVSSFDQAEEGITAIGTALDSADTSMKITNGQAELFTKTGTNVSASAKDVAASLFKVSATGEQVTDSFEQAITNGSNLWNSLLTLESAAGGGASGMKLLEQAGKDYVAQILPMAAGSKVATEQIYDLAYQAGYRGAPSFEALSKWIGNTKDPAQDLSNIVGKLTIAAGNLTGDVQNLSTALQTNLSAAMATAILQASGGQKVLDSAANAVKLMDGNVQNLVPTAQKLASQFLTLTGNTTQAKNEFVTFYEKMGLTQGQADQLWGDLNTKGVGAFNNVKSAANQAALNGVDVLKTSLGEMSGTMQQNASYTNGLVTYYDNLASHAKTPLQKNIDDAREATFNFGNQIANLQGPLANGSSNMDSTASHGHGLQNQFDDTKSSAQKMGSYMSGTMPGQMQTGDNSMSSSKTNANRLETAFHDVWSWAGNMARSITQLPESHSTTVHVSGKGSTSISSTIAGVAGGIINLIAHMAEGGVIPGFAPGQDTVPAMLSPGEGILTPHAVQSLGGPNAIHALNRSAKHFAYGGVVGTPDLTSLPDMAQWATSTVNTGEADITKAYQTVLDNSVKSMANKAQAALAAKAKAMQAVGTSGFVHPTGSGASVEALMTSMAASIGWTGQMLTDLLAVENREAGFSLTARNASSGAYGLAQFIDGPGEYAQYGGNVNTASGQITAMFNYIKQRYGNPSAAWSHEVNFGWYDQGGMLQPGMTLAYNGTGQPEKVGGGPSGGGPDYMAHTVVNLDGQKIWENMQQRTLRYSSRNSGNGRTNGIWSPS